MRSILRATDPGVPAVFEGVDDVSFPSSSYVNVFVPRTRTFPEDDDRLSLDRNLCATRRFVVVDRLVLGNAKTCGDDGSSLTTGYG